MARKKYEEPVIEETSYKEEGIVSIETPEVEPTTIEDIIGGSTVERNRPGATLVTTDTIYSYDYPAKTRKSIVTTIPKGKAFRIENKIEMLNGTWYKVGIRSYIPEGPGYIIK